MKNNGEVMFPWRTPHLIVKVEDLTVLPSASVTKVVQGECRDSFVHIPEDDTDFDRDTDKLEMNLCDTVSKDAE